MTWCQALSQARSFTVCRGFDKKPIQEHKIQDIHPTVYGKISGGIPLRKPREVLREILCQCDQIQSIRASVPIDVSRKRDYTDTFPCQTRIEAIGITWYQALSQSEIPSRQSGERTLRASLQYRVKSLTMASMVSLGSDFRAGWLLVTMQKASQRPFRVWT
jgi:hypothetical protein